MQTPQSLRGYLMSRTTHALTERINLAKQIAKAVNYVHTLGFVHKNVRPENIVGFDSQDSGLDSFYLIGFEHFRTADSRTFRHGDSAWFKNIYRHPDRQGMHPTEDYSM
jgi:serine/threonine protein kinase